tara:strand:- start:898 stop:1887 length:990 start_codon:yes stop_codon:yes gene_type:complete
MSDATPSRLGQVNGANSAFALFLKVFSGEVLTTFDELNIMKSLHMTRTISSGKSAQFPVMGTSTAAYHTPGAYIDGTAIKHNEQVVVIDGLLIASSFIANIDEAMNHYDVRGEYAKQLGQALANQFDKNCLIQIINGARQTTTITGGKPAAANAITLGANGDDDDGDKLADHLFTMARMMDQNDVPQSDRYVVFDPIQYYALVSSTKAINRDWGGSGSYADGEVLRVAGINVLSSNHLPALANVTSHPTGIMQNDNSYIGDFQKTLAVGFHRSAIGTVQLMGLKVESEYEIQRQGYLTVAKFALGTKWLRPESCYEIKYTSNQSGARQA